jgi:hypothetical protein
VSFSKVAHQSHHKSDVRFLVEQVLVFACFGPRIALGLLKLARARTVGHNQLIIHHPTGFALQVLHLVGELPSLQNFQQTLFDFRLRKRRFAESTRPLGPRGFQIVVFVQVSGAANVELDDGLTGRADYIGYNKRQRRLLALHNFVRKFLDFQKPQHVFEQSLGLELECWV